MSGNTVHTEHLALLEMAQTLTHFNRLCGKSLSAGDEVRLRHAEKIIKDVIRGNGYQIIYNSELIGLKKIQEDKR